MKKTVFLFIVFLKFLLPTFCTGQSNQSDFINEYGIEFKLIDAGSFLMGSANQNQMPVHKVTITNPFYIGIYEVTQEQYQEVMKKEIKGFKNANIPIGVSWLEAAEFCKKLCELTGDIYRLPTEAEWEYAARGGMEQKKYVWGDGEIPIIKGIKQANVPDESLKKLYPNFKIIEAYNDGFDGLAPVGSFAPNGYGLFDMAGNVWERCSDYFDVAYYTYSPQNNPQGPKTGNRRVLRGGGCWYSPDELTVASRAGSPMDRGGSNDGFRIVKELGSSEIEGPYLGQKPPGVRPIVFAPEIICMTGRSEFAESFSPDGKAFFYTMWQTPGRSDERIWYTEMENGGWSKPKPAPFGFDCFEYRPFFSCTGDQLYFLSKRPLKGDTALTTYANLWVVRKNESHWGEPELINLGDENIAPRYFSISQNGSIYFNMEGQYGIYKSELRDGLYGHPQKLPDVINSVAGASHAFIAPDESYILFDAYGLTGIEGDYDLNIAFKNEDGNWDQPIHMGLNINTNYFEGAASVSTDGKYLFFSRFINGASDIYWVSAQIIEELKSKNLKTK